MTIPPARILGLLLSATATFSAGFLVAQDASPALAPPALPASGLVLIQEGDCPVVISAPHGGTLSIPNVPPRKGEGLEKGPSGFFIGRDGGTEELAIAVAAAVETRLGRKPYLVAARFHRRYVDANRPPAIAYESAAAKPVYDEYHAALAKSCESVRFLGDRGLLLDIHGQGTAADTIFRGTQNGKTDTHLRERYGEAAHTGPEGLFGRLAAHGCKVFPEVGSPAKERGGFTGGYIVQTYGSHRPRGLDAYQLECGTDYRGETTRVATADKIAAAVEEYAKRYLAGVNAAVK